MKKILVIGMGVYPFGLEKRATTMLKNMQNIKPYYLLSSFGDGKTEKLLDKYQLEYEHAPFGYLGFAKPTWTFITLLNIPLLYVKILSIYIQKKCDSIMILCMPPLLNALIPIAILKYFMKAELIFYYGDVPHDSKINRVNAKLMKVLSNKIIANSNAVKTGLSKLGLNNGLIKVIYNGVDIKSFSDLSSNVIRNKYTNSSNSIIIGFIGQITKNKGIWDFVNAAEYILEQKLNCIFLIIGKDIGIESCKKDIEKYINLKELSDNIYFVDWVDIIDMPKIYSEIDLVVVPSRFNDSAPNVIIEAMASGIPVVTTRVGGIPELMLDGITGFLVENGKPLQLSKYIIKLIKDIELRKAMGINAKKYASERYDISKNARMVEEVIINE